jgi:hypothetical protein
VSLRVALAGASGFLAGVLLVAVLGGAKPARTATVTVTTPGAGTVAVVTRVRVPDVVGRPLDEALDALGDLGLRGVFDEDQGLFGVVVERNWEVTAQDPAPGPRVDQGTEVRLGIARR